MSKSHLIYGIFKFHEVLFNTQPLGFVKITFFLQSERPDSKAPRLGCSEYFWYFVPYS